MGLILPLCINTVDQGAASLKHFPQIVNKDGRRVRKANTHTRQVLNNVVDQTLFCRDLQISFLTDTELLSFNNVSPSLYRF